ncbi:MAG TPA: hypothetical protein PLU75_07865 [Oscillospiraceae bacterium]|nr:hypothetical protein [Oscillospiraceae bacterium]HRW56158.1 hypothetical protein [Oscillospiraceae bacterium]
MNRDYMYQASTYDIVRVLLPKGTEPQFKQLAFNEHLSLNQYVMKALEQFSGLDLQASAATD